MPGRYLSGFPFYSVVFSTQCGRDKLHLIHTRCLYDKIKDCDSEAEVFCQEELCNRKIAKCKEIKKNVKSWIDIDEGYNPVLQLVLEYKRDSRFNSWQVADFQRKIYAMGGVINEDRHLKKLYMDANIILGDTYLDLYQSEEGVDRAISAYQQAVNCSDTHDVDAEERMEKAKVLKSGWLVEKAQSNAVILLEDCFSAVEAIRREYRDNSVIACYQAELHLLRAKFALDALGDRSGRLSVLESAHVFFDELSSEREKFKKALEALSEKKCQELVSIAEQRAGNNLSKFFVLLEKLRAYYPKNGNIYSCLGKIAKQHMAEIEELLTDPEQIDPDVLKEAFDSIGFCRKYGGKGQTFKRKVQDLTELYLYPPSGKFDTVLKAVRRELNSVRPDSGQLVKLCAWFDTIEKHGLHGQKKALERLQPRVNMLLK